MYIYKYFFLLWRLIRDLFSRGAAHIIVGNFLTKFISFFGSIFLVRLLTKEEYGVLMYFENITSYFFLFAGLGLAAGIQRYLIIADKREIKKSCIKRAFVKGNLWNIFLVISCISFIIYYPHPGSFSDHIFVGICLAICIPFIFCYNTCFSAFRADFDYKSYAYLALTISFILIIARIIGAALGGLNYSVTFRLFAEIFCAVFCFYILYRRHYRNIKYKTLEKSFKKELDKYSVQMMFTDGLWAVFMLNDLFLLGQFSGNEVIIAEYKVALVIPANLSIFISAIGVFVAPYFTKHDNNGNNNWIKDKFKIVLIASTTIMGVCVCLCYLFASPIVNSLYGSQYASSVPIMKILLLGSFFNNGIRTVVANILSAIGKQKINLIIAFFGLLIQIIFSLFLIPSYGAIGVAWVNVLVYSFMGLSLLFLTRKIIIKTPLMSG